MSNDLRPLRKALFTLAVIAAVSFALHFLPRVHAQKEDKAAGDYSAQFHTDAVTDVIRDPHTRLFRVDTSQAAQFGTVIADHGSFSVVSSSDVSKLRESNAVELESTIELPGSSFEPLNKTNKIENYGKGYYIVQLGTIATDVILDGLRSAGVEILQYVPHQAFFVYGDEAAIAKAATHNRVRWIGELLPEHKLSKELSAQLDSYRSGKRSVSSKQGVVSPLERAGKETAIFDIQIFKRADKKALSDSLASAFGGKVVNMIEPPANFFNIIRAELPVDSIESLAAVPDVISIVAWQQPAKEDEVAAQILAGNYIGNVVSPAGYNPLTQFGVNGQGVTVSVVDDGIGIPGVGGFYVTSANSVNANLRGATAGASGHGHLQASIIAGDTPYSTLDSNGYNYGIGIAPKAHTINVPLLRNNYSGSEANTVNDTVTTAGPNGVLGSISNNSWGSGLNSNAYDSLAAQYDGFVMDASAAAGIDPLTIIFSAGNSGTSGMTRPKVAKNVITVAASENVRPTLPSSSGSTSPADNLEQLPDFSSRGLAADGRIKPDIAAPGDAITGGRSGSDALFGNIDEYHRISSGTSHAAPQVAGAAALFTQFWKGANAGINPSPALMKAAVINAGIEMTGAGATAPVPNGNEGWGRLNMKLMLNTGVPTKYVDQSVAFGSVGQSVTYTGIVGDTSKETRIALTWTDPPAASDPALVNNLDLSVTIGGITYRGNVFAGGYSTAGGTSDNRNNVESIRFPAGIPAGTPFAITVTAAALNGDGIRGNGDTTDQHFGLVAYNFNETPTAVVQSNATAYVSESRIPLNGVPDPGETVTVSLSLKNIGLASTSDLTATLLATGGVLSPSAPVNYGAVSAASNSPAQNFAFVVSPAVACGGTITLTWKLNDGVTDHGIITLSMRLGNYIVGTAQTFSNTTSISVPGSGTFGIGNPYPSNISVNGVGTTTEKVTVTLRNISHSYPSDIDVLLVSPTGRKFILMSDVIGGSDMNGQTYTFDDAAAALISNTGTPPSSGTFRPTNYGVTEAFTAPAPAAPYLSPASGGSDTLASAFGGDDPNGTWSLYAMDDSSTDSGQFAGGWSITVTPASYQCAAIPTAANVSASGQVLDRTGRAIKGAIVSITDEVGLSRSARTNTFGYFAISGLPAGRSYIVTTSAKRYSFEPQLLNLNDNVSDFKIVSLN